MKESLEQEKAITLIALVITIIVLLILTTVTIATLTGENGIISKAREAKEKTEIAEIIEKAKIDLLGVQIENNGSVTTIQLKTIFEKYFDDVPETLPDDLSTIILKTKAEYGSHDITLSDIWNGSVSSVVEKTYTVTYNANGGKEAPENQVKIQGIDLTLSSTEPTREGYDFKGWAKESDATTPDYALSENLIYSDNKDVELFAVWDLHKYYLIGGDEVELGGGWEEKHSGSIYSAVISSFVEVCSGDYQSKAGVVTKNMIDMTNFKMMHIDYKFCSSTTNKPVGFLEIRFEIKFG